MAMVSVVSAEEATIHFYPNDINKKVYWDVDVISGSTLLPQANDYAGWCADMGVSIGEGTHTFTVYSSLNPSSLPTAIVKLNWDKINYVINHKNGADWMTVQAVIWHYLGQSAPFHSSINGWSETKYNELITDADKYGTGFTPFCNQKYAVILYKVGYQPIFVEVNMPDNCINPPPAPRIPLVGTSCRDDSWYAGLSVFCTRKGILIKFFPDFRKMLFNVEEMILHPVF